MQVYIKSRHFPEKKYTGRLRIIAGSWLIFCKIPIFLSCDFCVVYPWGQMNGPSCCLRYAHALMDICVTGPRGPVGLVFHSCYPPIVGIHGNVTGAGDVAIHHFLMLCTTLCCVKITMIQTELGHYLEETGRFSRAISGPGMNP